MRKRRIVALLADLHSGNKLALLNPETTLYQEGQDGELVPYKPQLGRLQLYLWQCFSENVQELRKLAGKDEIVLLVQGDLTQGYKHASLQVSERHYEQTLIAIENLRPLLDLPNIKHVRIVGGTEAHDGLGMSSTISVITSLKQLYPRKKFRALYHGVLNINGCKIDYAHHGPTGGSRRWLGGNTLLYYLRDIVMSEYEKTGKVAARVVTRAHQHVYQRATLNQDFVGKWYTFDAILLPSYCGIGDFARKVTKNTARQTHGMVALEIVDGRLEQIVPLIKELDLRVEETI